MIKTKFEAAIRFIRESTSDILNPENNENNEKVKIINDILDHTENGYCLIQWPESQEYMEEDWFHEEAILALGSEDKTGDSAYFIPIKRIIK
jgi:hypothetical protein